MFSTAGESHKKTPPINGAFPLDHEGECHQEVVEYLQCVRSNQGKVMESCRSLARTYFECRLRRQLITLDDWRILGLGEPPSSTIQGDGDGDADGQHK